MLLRKQSKINGQLLQHKGLGKPIRLRAEDKNERTETEIKELEEEVRLRRSMLYSFKSPTFEQVESSKNVEGGEKMGKWEYGQEYESRDWTCRLCKVDKIDPLSGFLITLLLHLISDSVSVWINYPRVHSKNVPVWYEPSESVCVNSHIESLIMIPSALTTWNRSCRLPRKNY